MNMLFNMNDTSSKITRVFLKDIDIPDILPPGYMTDSISELGTLEEVKLMRRSKKFEIIDGRRRLATMKAQGIEFCEAKVFDDLKPHQIAIMTLVANYNRSHNLISELEALQKLEAKKVDSETLRRYMNVSKNKVVQLKRLLDLPENLYKALSENRITESIAKAVAVMNKKQQKRLSKIYETTGKLTAQDIKGLKDQQKQEMAESMDDSLFETPDRIDIITKEIQEMTDGNKVKLWRQLVKLGIIQNESFVKTVFPGGVK